MLLSTILGKNIYERGRLKGVCEGVSLSAKARQVKYLICRDGQSVTYLPFTSVDYVTDSIKLKKFSPAFPRHCEPFFLHRPVYDEKGAYLGKTADLHIERQTALYLLLDSDKRIPVPYILCLSDAVILKKTPLFPIARRIPAHALSLLGTPFQEDNFVTKKALQTAAKKGNLIKFTLSLSPFSLPSDGVFSGEF